VSEPLSNLATFNLSDFEVVGSLNYKNPWQLLCQAKGSAMPANIVELMTSLIYDDMGAAEFGSAAPPLPPGALNHLRWTLLRKPSWAGTTVTGSEFLTHHLDYMLTCYEAWAAQVPVAAGATVGRAERVPRSHGQPADRSIAAHHAQRQPVPRGFGPGTTSVRRCGSTTTRCVISRAPRPVTPR
jgi:hypothetical protein